MDAWGVVAALGAGMALGAAFGQRRGPFVTMEDVDEQSWGVRAFRERLHGLEERRRREREWRQR